MLHPPQTWFSSLVAIEVLFQLPFFFLAVYAIFNSNRNGKNKNTLFRGDGLFRSLCIIYGSSTATTLIPIFASILTDADSTPSEKGVLLSFYLPYIVFPLWLVIIAVCEQNVFGGTSTKLA